MICTRMGCGCDGTMRWQEGKAPRGLCRCDAVLSCAMLNAVALMPVLSGNVTPPVDSNQQSGVVFTELYTYVARSDLRIYFQHVQQGQFAAFNVTSQRFSISAGILQSIAVSADSDPSSVRTLCECLHVVCAIGVRVQIQQLRLSAYVLFDLWQFQLHP